jgi:hypothetical protein
MVSPSLTVIIVPPVRDQPLMSRSSALGAGAMRSCLGATVPVTVASTGACGVSVFFLGAGGASVGAGS